MRQVYRSVGRKRPLRADRRPRIIGNHEDREDHEGKTPGMRVFVTCVIFVVERAAIIRRLECIA